MFTSMCKVAVCTVGTSMLLCWPSAWNEKCLMPLVCLEGLSLFRRWAAMHYWLQNTPAMLFHLFRAQLTASMGFILEQLRVSLYINVCAFLFGCTLFVCVILFPSFSFPPPFPIAPSGRLNGGYTETTPLSPHPLYTVRWRWIAQDKRQR